MTMIQAVVDGKEHLLAVWPDDLIAGDTAPIRTIVTNAARILEDFGRVAERIRGDERLSATAQVEDQRAAATERLKQMATQQKALNEAAQKLSDRRNALLAVEPYRDGDHAAVAIDLALAEQLRGADAAYLSSVLVLGTNPRLLQAIVRLPAELTGLSEDIKRAAIRNAAFHDKPVEASAVDNLGDAIEHAQAGLTRAFRVLATLGGVDFAEQHALVGGDLAQLGGDPERVARRAELQTSIEALGTEA